MSRTETPPQRIDTPKGRYYHTVFGTFPSVTTILAATKPPEMAAALQRWYERNKNKSPTGEQMAENARQRGTYIHGRVEKHLQGLPPEPYSEREKQLGVQFSMRSLAGPLSRIHKPLLVEACVFCPIHKYAGTLDLLQEDSLGEPEVWDWKNREDQFWDTSFVEDYYCQLAAYIKAVPRSVPHIGQIHRARIFVALTKHPQAQEFVMTDSKIDYYWRYFLRRLAKFRSLGQEFSFEPDNKPTRRRSSNASRNS